MKNGIQLNENLSQETIFLAKTLLTETDYDIHVHNKHTCTDFYRVIVDEGAT